MITVIGIGADGWPSLGEEARAAVLAADLLVGGERQLDLVPAEAPGERRAWPTRLTDLVDELPALARQRASSCSPAATRCCTASARRSCAGSATRRGARASSRRSPPSRWPARGCAGRSADVELVSATSRHRGGRRARAAARPPPRRPRLRSRAPRRRSRAWLRERGFGASRLVVLEELGGEARERIEESTADAWGDREAAALHLVALEVRGDGPLLGRDARPARRRLRARRPDHQARRSAP